MAEANSNPLVLTIPIFKGGKNDIWRSKMETYFMSQDLWDIVNDGISFPEQTTSTIISTLAWQQEKQLKERKKKDAAALFVLKQTVDDNIFSRIYGARTAKEAWDTLKEEFQGDQQPTTLSDEDKKIWKTYLQLYKDILEGNLDSVQRICSRDNLSLEARITENLDTALHVAAAVGTDKANRIVKYLLETMSTDQVALKNKEGNTVLSIAAIVGNYEVAEMILNGDRYRNLIEVPNNSERIPLIEAARHGHKDMINCLVHNSNYLNNVAATNNYDYAVSFINSLIIAGFYDLALNLLKEYPNLATKQSSTGESVLSAIAGKPSAFPSGKRKLRWWHYLHVFKIPNYKNRRRQTRETMLMPEKALELVKHLCKEITNNSDDYDILKRSLFLAAELGVCEVVEEIIKSFPAAVWFKNKNNHNILHLAIMNRQEKVLQLIYQMSGREYMLLMSPDVEKNNILHLVGKLGPKNQLNLIPSAASQMQHELQWFKKVEKIVPPDYKEEKNYKGETPGEVFTEEHKELRKEGEKWIKKSATSCSVAAALVATIVFAAAIAIPGEYNNDGDPKFYKQIAFTIFSISDAFSLLSSIASIIMFLFILTATYGEQDFLHVLPNLLKLCRFMLFLSLASLMVAFFAAVFMVFCGRRVNWVFGLVFASAILPLFISIIYSLLSRKLKECYLKLVCSFPKSNTCFASTGTRPSKINV